MKEGEADKYVRELNIVAEQEAEMARIKRRLFNRVAAAIRQMNQTTLMENPPAPQKK